MKNASRSAVGSRKGFDTLVPHPILGGEDRLIGFDRLLLQFGKSHIDPRKDWSLPEL
jgi:hypothetical protein